ncbi:MAG TPA: glycosyltransferase family 4 protein, partial [Polyangiales bacterium]|nr:glycosyltransferase family 4 protein [Polyangiales bacterium]
PLWRMLASHPDLDVKVFYFSDHSIRGGIDKGFGRSVAWDIDMTSGYQSEFLSRHATLDQPSSVSIPNALGLLRRERPDWILIAGYTYRFEHQLRLLAPLVGARLMIRGEQTSLSLDGRGPLKALARAAFLRVFYRGISAFCYPGTLGREHLQSFGVPASKLFFSPYSVDDTLIRSALDSVQRSEARRALGIPDDRFVFVLSGKIYPGKDPFAILDAIEAMPRSQQVGLIVLGDGEQRAPFEARAKQVLGERLIFAGFVNQSQLGRYFIAADALVLTSKRETWGLVVNEAMHYGLPVITNDRVGCNPDLIKPGETGYLYPCGDTRALANAMQQLVDDRERSSAMGAAAKRHIDANYSCAASARGIFQAFGVKDHA